MNHYSLLCIKPDYMPKNIIKILLDSKSEDFSNATTGYSRNEQVSNYRKTKWLTLPEEIGKHLHDSIFQTHEEVLKQIYSSTIKSVESPQFLRYDIGDEYKVHNDSEDLVGGKLKQVVERDISLLYYLNDDYDGGELEFTKLQLTIKPKTGMLIAFPSYLEFEHRVHPVTKGTRYSIVSWIATEKRLYERPYDRQKVQQTWVLPSGLNSDSKFSTSQ